MRRAARSAEVILTCRGNHTALTWDLRIATAERPVADAAPLLARCSRRGTKTTGWRVAKA
jgi:hypothetical protein